MKFILSVGLLVIAILAQSFADHEHDHHDDDSHPCAQPKFVLEKGKVGCFALITRYYHNHATGKCEELEYDGCNKNANNFETKEECEKTCNEWHEAHKDHQHGSGSGHENCKHDHEGHEGHEGHDHHHHEHNHDHSHHHH